MSLAEVPQVLMDGKLAEISTQGGTESQEYFSQDTRERIHASDRAKGDQT